MFTIELVVLGYQKTSRFFSRTPARWSAGSEKFVYKANVLIDICRFIQHEAYSCIMNPILPILNTQKNHGGRTRGWDESGKPTER